MNSLALTVRVPFATSPAGTSWGKARATSTVEGTWRSELQALSKTVSARPSGKPDLDHLCGISLPPRGLRVRGIGVVPLDAGMALEAAYLDLPHPDPADRFILATALRLGAVLVTKDERLREYPRVKSLWE